MDYREEIISAINKFYIDSIEEFREAEARISVDSKFRRIFQKKDYGSNIRLLKSCKNSANRISIPRDIPEDDLDSQRITDRLRECIRTFVRLCDSYIAMQSALERKSKGEKVSYQDYNEMYRQTRERHAQINENLKELDILYADYTEEGYASDEGYLTYDMIVGKDGRK